jgi:type IV secretion system protein VirB10
MAVVNESTEDFASTPAPETGKWRIKRNLHFWIIGFVVILLVSTILVDTFKQEHNKAVIQEQEAEQKNKSSAKVNNLDLPPSLNDLDQQLKDQAEKAKKENTEKERAKSKLPGSELPVPGSGNGSAPLPGNNDLQHQEAIQKQKRDEQIRAGSLLALDGGDTSFHEKIGGTLQGAVPDAVANAWARASGASSIDPNAIGHLMDQFGEKKPTSPAKNDSDWLDKVDSTQRVRGKEEPLRPVPSVSRMIVHQGTIIPAVLLTEINSDMPGQLTARTTMDVYDSITGTKLMIPMGSRLIGVYNNDIRTGQERVLAAFTRLILPSGASVQLGAMNVADSEGKSGMTDEVNNHFWTMFGSNFLIAALAKMTEPSQPSSVTVIGGGSGSLTNSAGQILVDTTRAITEKNRSLSPTLIIHKGHKINVIVNKDMVFDGMQGNHAG